MSPQQHSTLQNFFFLLFVVRSTAMSAFQGVPKVAIVGGGISGLSCARRLQALGIESTVFDTGKKATGGRCSSRNLQVDGQSYVTDHSSQFFTATSDRFKSDLKRLQNDGSVMEWEGRIAQISSPSLQKTIDLNVDKPRYVGKAGMGSFAKKLSEGLEVKRPVWVRDDHMDCYTIQSFKSYGPSNCNIQIQLSEKFRSPCFISDRILKGTNSSYYYSYY